MRWGEAEIAKLRELAARPEKLSAKEIAGYFEGVSRNAVIGACLRNHIELLRLPCRASLDREKREYVPRAKRRSPFVAPFTVDDSPLRCVPVEPLNLTLMELERNSCRYPYGGDNGEPITFCGNLRHGESSYCAGHYRLTRNTRLGLSLSEAERERRRRRMQHIRSGLNSTEAA